MAIKILSNVLLTHEDWDYRDAVNSRGHMYNPPTTITVDKHKYILGAGQSDDITLFQEDDNIYILTINRRMGYAGLEMIAPDKQMLHEILFLQDHQFDSHEGIPKNFFDISVRKQLKSLRLYEA